MSVLVIEIKNSNKNSCLLSYLKENNNMTHFSINIDNNQLFNKWDELIYEISKAKKIVTLM
mgnify:CR=1 FL=1|tara:strand:+ start:54 stop:236 length:183 start_codon:yes stop_codon:yes gene_type:complete